MPAIWAVLLLVGVSPAAETTRRRSAEAPVVDLSEEVARLVAQLADDSWKRREAGSRRLASMMPGVLPYLHRYRNHSDPEVAARIERLLVEHAWVTTGAMIMKVRRGSRAEKLGIRAGDVILKIDEADVTGHRILGSLPDNANREYHLWRDGKVVRLTIPVTGRIGVVCIDWGLHKGGVDQVLGTVA
ncbi:MAG: PDZ domain-containing protein, partial [Planctomycetota bacterium]